MTFVTSVALPDLSVGAGYALWGFRAAAARHIQCPTLIRGFEDAFDDFARPALGGLEMFAHALGVLGGRKIKIAGPGCGYTTADELSIISLLSAAQAQNKGLCKAHLSWLMCGKGEETALTAALGIGEIFQSAGFGIHAPDVKITPSIDKSFTSFHQAGRA